MGDIYSRMNPLMDGMLIVFNKLKNCAFAVDKDIAFKLAVGRIKSFFDVDDNGAAIFTCFFVEYLNGGQRPIECGMIARDIDLNPLVLLSFSEQLDLLEEKGFIVQDASDDSLSKAKYYRVPDVVIKAILKNDKKLLEEVRKIRNPELKYPDEIAEKELFFEKNIQNELKRLQTYLAKENFEKIQKRLVEKAMPKGLCIMFYGESGTGKTESVYQIARKTERAVFHVNIGSMISQWVGGTENNLAALFEKYKRFCKQAKARNEEIPILLFNEADAIFGKRMNSPTQGAEVEENKTQALLLDYIENLEGILMVTTNIAGNFDSAFERRFLFKIEFEKPNLEIKTKIWKSKLNWLTKKSALRLASSYEFSGGEIDNIARKATMNEVITGRRNSVAELENYCKQEKLEKNKFKMIGFKS